MDEYLKGVLQIYVDRVEFRKENFFNQDFRFDFCSFVFGKSGDNDGRYYYRSRFRGEWVPVKASCASSQLKLKLDSNLVTFKNGTDEAQYNKLEQCFSCMGKDVEGFVWLTTDAMGDSPFTIYLDGSKKKTIAVSVDFTNDKKLGNRFPFGSAPLKKCK